MVITWVRLLTKTGGHHDTQPFRRFRYLGLYGRFVLDLRKHHHDPLQFSRYRSNLCPRGQGRNHCNFDLVGGDLNATYLCPAIDCR